jgi:hypothetical protein
MLFSAVEAVARAAARHRSRASVDRIAMAFATKTIDFATKTVDFATKTVNFATKTVNFATNADALATKTVNFATNADALATKTVNFATKTVDIAIAVDIAVAVRAKGRESGLGSRVRERHGAREERKRTRVNRGSDPCSAPDGCRMWQWAISRETRAP